MQSYILQENDEIRSASIMLLGNLSKFGLGEPVFKDQIHNVLVSLLMHLSDPSAQVVKVSLSQSSCLRTGLSLQLCILDLIFSTVFLSFRHVNTPCVCVLLSWGPNISATCFRTISMKRRVFTMANSSTTLSNI